MRKRLWDLAKSRIEIATILPGHRHKVCDRLDAITTDSFQRFAFLISDQRVGTINLDDVLVLAATTQGF